MIGFPGPRLVVGLLLVASAVAPPTLSAPTTTAAPSGQGASVSATQGNAVVKDKVRDGSAGQQVAIEEEELALLKGAKIRSHGQAEAAIPVPGGMASVNPDGGFGGPPSPVVVRSQRRSHPETITNNEVDTGGSGTQTYTPLDMAQYVFSTGDERSVTTAIEDLLQQGAMSPEEAISFLQQMRFNLIYLQAQYAQEQRKQEQRRLLEQQLQQQIHSKRNQQHGYGGGDLPDGIMENAIPDREGSGSEGLASQKEYNDLVSRLKMADMLYTEYSLEEVIYQLAKVMFTQSLSQGSTESQRALHKFTMFLESEAQQGRISRQLERKVLDVMLASLSDVLADHPELLTAARNGLVAEDAASAASGAVPAIEAPPPAPVAPPAAASAPSFQTSNAAARLLRQLLQLAPELAAAAVSPSPPSQQKPDSVSVWSESGLVKSANNPPAEQQEDAGVRQLHALKMGRKPSLASSISPETRHRNG